MSKVLGIDSSTQSTKAVLVDADDGTILAEQRFLHPAGTEVDPAAWLRALTQSTTGLLEQADAVAVGGQQHGMVALDSQDRVVRPALLWNDTRSSSAAEDLVAELGGPAEAARRTGSVHVASITSTKMRWMRDNEADNARRTHRVVLPHDYVSHALAVGGEWFTDRGDASGTGYFCPTSNAWAPELAAQAIGHDIELPTIADHPAAVMGHTATGAIVAAGTGDNMAAALGLNMSSGDISLSIGTSGVAAMVSDHPAMDPTGLVTGFADATGRWLPLVCTINAAKILDLACTLLAVDHDELSRLSLQAPAGANGAVLLPYLDGERTPNRPLASGTLHGITSSTTRADIARAHVEALACSLTDAVEFLGQSTGQNPQRILLIGGAARSSAVRQILPAVLGREVSCPAPREYVALGAAAQAAWALAGGDTPPQWSQTQLEVVGAAPTPQVLDAYRSLRDRTGSWT
ncbi:xylulokinase [Gephyromycinifex aptenodytis]|uniref:xylulokinase n=1 Tax=Gephyromycinifex aptenodytis TaxID=2716227 RepID=UPI001447F628|nr:xylulokinase [Gephyromycinifex aptenodytis]